MKIETYIVVLLNRTVANRLEGTTHTSLQGLKQTLGVDGIYYDEIIKLTDFMDKWNDCDCDDKTFIDTLTDNHISYVHIIN